MNAPLSSLFPRPSAADEDDVVWTLQTAAVQWQRGLRADAIAWVRKAADTSIRLGQALRAEELRNHAARLAEHLWADDPRVNGSSRPPNSGEVIELDDFDEVGGKPPPTSAIDLTNELTYYGDDEVESERDVLPQDLDLRSDSSEPAGSDSFMSISPESDAAADSFMSVAPEPNSSRPSLDSIRAGLGTAAGVPRAPALPSALASVPSAFMPPATAPAPPRGSKPPAQPHLERLSGLSRAILEAKAEVRSQTVPAPRAVSTADALVPPDARVTVPPPNSSGRDASGAARASSSPPSVPRVDGLPMEIVEALSDLPEEAQWELSTLGTLSKLAAGEELTLREGAALITRGGAHVALTSSDVSAARVGKGSVIPVQGTRHTRPLRLIADEGDTRVIRWDAEQIRRATGGCPWVVDDLRMSADRYQAYAGAGAGLLGSRLDDALRSAVYERLQVRVLEPRELVAKKGEPMAGLFVVAVGELEVGGGVIGAGEFVFPGSVIGVEPAPELVRAGSEGGLALYAPRPIAHELMMSVPPLLEILAS